MSIPAKKNETPQKTQKNNNLLKTKRILNAKISAKEGQFLHSVCQWRRFAHLPPSVTPLGRWYSPSKYFMNNRFCKLFMVEWQQIVICEKIPESCCFSKLRFQEQLLTLKTSYAFSEGSRLLVSVNQGKLLLERKKLL